MPARAEAVHCWPLGRAKLLMNKRTGMLLLEEYQPDLENAHTGKQVEILSKKIGTDMTSLLIFFVIGWFDHHHYHQHQRHHLRGPLYCAPPWCTALDNHHHNHHQHHEVHCARHHHGVLFLMTTPSWTFYADLPFLQQMNGAVFDDDDNLDDDKYDKSIFSQWLQWLQCTWIPLAFCREPKRRSAQVQMVSMLIVILQCQTI